MPLSMPLGHPENDILRALRKDDLIGNPPNYNVDSDVEDADGTEPPPESDVGD